MSKPLATLAVSPLALSPREAAAYLGVSRRTISRLIQDRKIVARKAGVRTLVDVESLRIYYANLPVKGDHPPLFLHPITGRSHRSRRRAAA